MRAGPGVTPEPQTAARTDEPTHPVNRSRASMAGAGAPFGGISPLRTRIAALFQRSASVPIVETAAIRWT